MHLVNGKSQSMKKFVIVILAITMMFALFAVVGCDSRDEALVGTWVFEGDDSWITTFNEDGTGSHAQDWGYGTRFEWSTSGSNLNWDYPGHEELYTPYSIDGDVLSITMEDGTVFRYVRD